MPERRSLEKANDRFDSIPVFPLESSNRMLMELINKGYEKWAIDHFVHSFIESTVQISRFSLTDALLKSILQQ